MNVTKQEAKRQLAAGLATGNATQLRETLQLITSRAQEATKSTVKYRVPVSFSEAPDGAAVHTLAESLAALTREILNLRSPAQKPPGHADPATTSQSGWSVPGAKGSAIPAAASTIRFSNVGFPISPLLSGLIGLFGRSRQEAFNPIHYHVAPPPVVVEGGVSGTGTVGAVSYGQDGLPRPVNQLSSSSPPITIQIQALDSRSFLDHSSEIARAVREAILNGHGLNEIVSEL